MISSVLTAYRGCLLYGSRVVIPAKLQRKFLNLMHTSHMGIVRTKSLARIYAWWPTLNKDIENLIHNCQNCQSYGRADSKVSPISWPRAESPWSRIHIDYAGPFRGKTLLIIVDSYSKWLEVIPVATQSTEILINEFRKLFVTHGIPETIVSDNGSSFTSHAFKQFCESNHIKLIFTAAYHPSSNGQAERYVQTTKYTLTKMFSNCRYPSENEWNRNLSQFLITQHVTPNVENFTPSELMFGRRIRTLADAIRPDYATYPTATKVSNQNNRELIPKRKFIVGSKVVTRNFGLGPDWIPGVVTEQQGPVNYRITDANGQVLARHADQIKAQPINTPESSPDSSTASDIPQTEVQPQRYDLRPNRKRVQFNESSTLDDSFVDADYSP